LTPLEVQGGGVNLSGSAYANALFSQNGNPRRGINLGYDTSGQTGIVAANTYGQPSNIAFWTYNGGWGERMRLSASGNVGIGTAAPTKKLEVNGDVKITGQVTISRQGDISMGDFDD
jgi:hypothetical protein